MIKKNCIVIALFIFKTVFAQITAFKANGKWGFNKDGTEFISAKYDTVIAFDSIKKICIACVKTKKQTPNKFIKINTSTLVCKYINNHKKELVIKIKNDTSGYFNFTNTEGAGYVNYQKCIVVTSSKDSKKYTVDYDFNQITFTGYDDIIPLSINDHYMIETRYGASHLNGVIDKNENIIIPMEYTHIKSNHFDTLFIACTAKMRLNGQDDIYNLNGKKIQSYNRHVDNAAKNFIIHKIFEPAEYYIISDLKKQKEITIHAEDIIYLGNEMVKIKINGKYNTCNLYELETCKLLNNE